MPERKKCGLCYCHASCMIGELGADLCKGPFLNHEQRMEAIQAMKKEKQSFMRRFAAKTARVEKVAGKVVGG